MKDFSTARLTIHQVDETEDPEEYLRLFNSAPDLLRAIHPEMDEDVWTLEDAEMYLWQNTVRENSVCVSARDEDGRLVGTAALLIPNPDDQAVWLGFLFVAGDLRQGELASELLVGLEHQLAQDGWHAIFTTAAPGSPRNQFWLAHGFTKVDERLNEDKQPMNVYKHQFEDAAPTT